MLGNDFFFDVASVHCEGTGFDDDDARHLTRLTEIRTLGLPWTRITDNGLEHLQSLTSLRLLDLRHTQVTDEGIDRLQLALPNCTIVR